MSKFGQFLKGSQKQPTKRNPPRALEEIKKELTQLSFELGQAQYHVEVYRADVKLKIQRMNELNREGTERQAIDNAAKEASNGQSA
jgi:hypothetical protein